MIKETRIWGVGSGVGVAEDPYFYSEFIYVCWNVARESKGKMRQWCQYIYWC